MYNLVIHCTENLAGTMLHFSLSETNDEEHTYPLAAGVHWSHASDEAHQDGLGRFLYQVTDSVVKALSGDADRVWSTER